MWRCAQLIGLAACVLVSERPATPAAEIVFGGYTWTVRSGHGGPGPNTWDERNVWLDAATNLHLKIALRNGQWSCAEVTLRKRLGFGRYQFQLTSRIDRFDDNVVLGLFNYPTGDVGPDATHEIDIEFARWGNEKNPIGNFTVWPVEGGLKQVTHAFTVDWPTDRSTHVFTWNREQVHFRSFAGHEEKPGGKHALWTYRPEDPGRRISRQPMPVHLNLWLFQGKPPKNGQEVEVIINAFTFEPEPAAGG